MWQKPIISRALADLTIAFVASKNFADSAARIGPADIRAGAGGQRCAILTILKTNATALEGTDRTSGENSPETGPGRHPYILVGA
jgi:hypothetical protein